MREALFLVIAIAAFVGAMLVPSATREEAPGVAPEDVLHVPAAERRTKADSYANWNAGETILERSGDGHFYAEVMINGSPVEALVDTGASAVALSAADAAALGLSWDDADVRVIGSGASGPVMGVPVTLDRIELGGHEASGVSGVIVTDGLGITLLGQSFLSTIDPVRIEGDRMVLGGG